MLLRSGAATRLRREKREVFRKEYAYRMKQWHYWFAWYPVRIDTSDIVWLEPVERRLREGFAEYFYCYRRPILKMEQ